MAGASIPSRSELMRQFQCARATVDQVVETLLAEGIMKGERGRGTFVAPVPGRASIEGVALVSREAVSGWHTEIEQGILEGLGSGVAVTRFVYDDLLLPLKWSTCAAYRAVYFVMPDAEHEVHLVRARRAAVPHLVVYRDPPESPFVSVDARGGATALVRTIHERLGCRRFAWFGKAESRFHFPERRYAGFLEGLLECGLPFRRDWVDLEAFPGDDAFWEAVFKGVERPEVIIVAERPMRPVLEQLERFGLKPGRDVVLASYDQVAPGTYPFPLFCLAKTTRETGVAAGRFALSLQGGGVPPLPQEYLLLEVIEYR